MLTREELEERLATLHLASLELVKNISLETLLLASCLRNRSKSDSKIIQYKPSF